MSKATLSLVNVWTEPEAGGGGFNPMAASMLWSPDDAWPGLAAPAFIYIHRWGGYPYDPVPAALGPALAEHGCVLLSLCLRRRGMEGQLMAVPDNDHRDIKLAIDYLHTNGFGPIYLVAEELGCISALNYLSEHKDNRVAGLTLLEPTAAPADWLSEALGEAAYRERVAYAGIAARQGAGMDTRIDIMTDTGLTITQQAMAFLGWWGPAARPKPSAMLDSLTVPVSVITKQADSLSVDYAACAVSESDIAAAPQALAGQILDVCSVEIRPRAPLEMVYAESAGTKLFGLVWSPPQPQRNSTALLLVHGLTSSPLSPLFLKMAPELAQQGITVLANEMRRSGWAGHESALLEYDAEDIDAWVQFLLERGFDKIVLAGASIGSISVGRYQSVRQHPNVVALAHLMPTADCPDWFRRGVGEGPYAEAVAQAKAALAAGQGDSELIDIDLRQPAPNKYGGRFRWTQRAASWLSWWGPEADSVNSAHIAEARVPLLLLSGTEDSYNDAARFAQLKQAAVNAPSVDEIWYPGIDHGLAGVEIQVANDLFAWLQKVGAV